MALGFDWLPPELIGAGVGALAGGSSGGGETSSTKTLDPRIASYVYGQDGKGGLLGDAASIYQQQMQSGGLNDMQRQGLDMRAQYLQSPQYTNSYQAMMNQGMGLLNSPIAGNPFTRSQGGQSGAPAVRGYQYRPSPVQAPIYRPAQQAPQVAAPGVSNSTQPGRTGQGGGNINVGGGGQGSGAPGGQGINNGVTSAALQAMAASENPAIRALSPALAALLGFGGYAVAGQQADAMGAAGNHLAASQPLANLGIGTISDADGNVRTISTPGMIAAADASMFGDAGNPNTSSTAFGGGWGVRGTGGGWSGGYGGGIGQSGGNASGMGSHQA